MTTPELVKLVKEMRALQREYFKNRSPVVMDQAKKLERAVDKALAEYEGGQQQMFTDNAPTNSIF